ncbi:single-stranded DNA-binding protein [Desulfococcaceae bacterium HSG8]|nr:single-stranded DNA-binding protein [Desulfococcaceae bacterium HSG8]
MASHCKIILIGYLGRDPELRYTPDGLAVANFSMAVTEKVKGEDLTQWFRVSAFGRTGEIAAEYLSKGKQVYIEGRLRTSEWTDNEGNRRFSLEVIASQLVLLGSRGDDAPRPSGYDAPRSAPAPRPAAPAYNAPPEPPPAARETPPQPDAPGMQESPDAGPVEDDIPF